jgi:hypothetical protein
LSNRLSRLAFSGRNSSHLSALGRLCPRAGGEEQAGINPAATSQASPKLQGRGYTCPQGHKTRHRLQAIRIDGLCPPGNWPAQAMIAGGISLYSLII